MLPASRVDGRHCRRQDRDETMTTALLGKINWRPQRRVCASPDRPDTRNISRTPAGVGATARGPLHHVCSARWARRHRGVGGHRHLERHASEVGADDVEQLRHRGAGTAHFLARSAAEHRKRRDRGAGQLPLQGVQLLRAERGKSCGIACGEVMNLSPYARRGNYHREWIILYDRFA